MSDEGTPTPGGLPGLSSPRRLALGLFLVCVLGFYLLAQVKLWSDAGSGTFPGPNAVLVRYFGDPTRSRLERALDPALPPDKNMYQYLALAESERPERRENVVRWIADGASRERWPDVAPIFTAEASCGQCHARGSDGAGNVRLKHDLPLQTYEDVLPLTKPSEGMALSELATSSHNHLFGFAVLALTLSFAFTATRWRGAIVRALIAASFTGALVDIASWWATRAWGAPWHWGVIVGGGVFGAAITAMALLTLDELWGRGVVGRLLARPLAALRVGRREP